MYLPFFLPPPLYFVYIIMRSRDSNPGSRDHVSQHRNIKTRCEGIDTWKQYINTFISFRVTRVSNLHPTKYKDPFSKRLERPDRPFDRTDRPTAQPTDRDSPTHTSWRQLRVSHCASSYRQTFPATSSHYTSPEPQTSQSQVIPFGTFSFRP